LCSYRVDAFIAGDVAVDSGIAISLRGYVNDVAGRVLSGGKGHFSCHLHTVFLAQMSIGLGNQNPAVIMPQPCGNNLEVNQAFDAVGTKKMAEAVIRKVQTQCSAGFGDRRSGVLNQKNPVGWFRWCR